MEPFIQKPVPTTLLSQLKSMLTAHQKHKNDLQFWQKVFSIISLYINKDGPISSDAQKLINYYLQHKSDHVYGELINQHKEIICKIYDYGILAESIDVCLATGGLTEIIHKKMDKTLKGDNAKSQSILAFNFCVEAVAIHLCQFINRFRVTGLSNTTFTNRQALQVLKRKSHISLSHKLFSEQVLHETVTLMQGYIDNIKPMLTNYLNMESLFEITSRNFKNKTALLTGYQYPLTTNKAILLGKVVNLCTIFDSSFTGREMIQNKLTNLTLSDSSDSSVEYVWSLRTCVTELEPSIESIFEKLPIFLKPKSNDDIFSFFRHKIMPTFRYQVVKSGYMEGPFLQQFIQVFVNVGKNPFELIVIPNTDETKTELQKFEGQENIWDSIQNRRVSYTKVKVYPKNLAVITSNNFYFLTVRHIPKTASFLSQIITWNILPKQLLSISNATRAVKQKRKLHKQYFSMPIELMFLDYLNHEYTKMKDLEIGKFLVSHVEQQLILEQKVVYDFIVKYPKIVVSVSPVPYLNRFCYCCKASYLNYCFQNVRKQLLCVICSKIKESSIQEIISLYLPQSIRYPLSLFKIKITKGKIPNEEIQNLYEKNVCCAQFIGSFESYTCKGTQETESKNVRNFPIKTSNIEQILFFNLQKQLKLATNEEKIIQLALIKPTNKIEFDDTLQKINAHCKTIADPQSLKKRLSLVYEEGNLVMETMFALTVPRRLFD